MFSECSSLSSLPDISFWKTNNLINMNYMFSECSLLSHLPNISNWNTTNIIGMSGIFYNCNKSLIIPDKFIRKTIK